MTPEAINALWTRLFPECPPVGYLFKHLYRERCARFAWLDGGRAPETAEDVAEVERRQRALLEGLFDGEPRLVLITTIPSDLETPPRDAPSYLNFDPHGRFLQSLGMHEFQLEFDTPSFWHLFASARENRPDAFGAVLRAAVSDPGASGVVNTLLMGPECARVLYVHAAGADAVLGEPAQRDALRERFGAWAT